MATTYRFYTHYRWPENKVPYTTENFPFPDKVNEAINDWWAKTGLEFKELDRANMDSTESYLMFKYETDARSQSHTNIGHTVGKKIHEVVVNSNNNKDLLRTLLHEIGDKLKDCCIEHQRKERDNFIRVNTENWGREWSYQSFDENVYRLNNSSVECIGIAREHNTSVIYDFKSVMHYDQYAFTSRSDPRPTIEIRDLRKYPFLSIMGTKAELTQWDINGIKNIYGI